MKNSINPADFLPQVPKKPNFDEEIDNLNPQQKKAVTCTGTTLVVSGAGTGKTRVLTLRYVWQMRQNPEKNILAMTFTNKAALEMKTRIQALINTESKVSWIGTFHSISVRVLRQYGSHIGISSNFKILDYGEQVRFLKNVFQNQHDTDSQSGYGYLQFLEHLDFFYNHNLNYDPKKTDVTGQNHQALRDLVCNGCETMQQTPSAQGRKKWGIFCHVLGLYNNYCMENNVMDFGMLITSTINLWKKSAESRDHFRNQFCEVMVDEFQDTNIAQMEWLMTLLGDNVDSSNDMQLFCVGDENQMIYSWRGARIETMLDFQKRFPKSQILMLEKNYRSTEHILQAANGLISHNTQKIEGKKLQGNKGAGNPIEIYSFVDSYEEARFIAQFIQKNQDLYPYKDIGVLVRTTAQMRLFEESFSKHNIPYDVVGGLKFYDRVEVKDMMSYLMLVNNPHNDEAFLRAINKPKQGAGVIFLQKLERIQKDLAQEKMVDKVSAFDALGYILENNMLNLAQQESFSRWHQNINLWRKKAASSTLDQVFDEIYEKSGYKSLLLIPTVENTNKRENINELRNIVVTFTNLDQLNTYFKNFKLSDAKADLFDEIAAQEDTTVKNTENQGTVSIMTIHASKGLEFLLVIAPGWEEGLFPGHKNQIKDMGENRRLGYVTITRGIKLVIISFAYSRQLFGTWSPQLPSRFIDEIPMENRVMKSLPRKINPLPLNKVDEKDERSFFKKTTDSFMGTKATSAVASDGIYKGRRVQHKTFGVGVVVSVTDACALVDFGSNTKRKYGEPSSSDPINIMRTFLTAV